MSGPVYGSHCKVVAKGLGYGHSGETEAEAEEHVAPIRDLAVPLPGHCKVDKGSVRVLLNDVGTDSEKRLASAVDSDVEVRVMLHDTLCVGWAMERGSSRAVLEM
jgi:hypothetical protein